MFAALLAGIAAGMRSMMPIAVVSVAAFRRDLPLEGTPFAFMLHGWLTITACLFAAGELVGDKLPFTPSRKRAAPFGFRLFVGAGCGAVLAATHGSLIVGAVAGAVGALIGTLGGYEARRRLAVALGRDLPAALIEDAVAIGLSVAAVVCVRAA